jgi:hypothetical protein
MPKIIRWIVILFLAFLLIGCIQTVTHIFVNKDGSGTLEETIVFSRSFMELLANFGGDQADEGGSEMWNEEELAAKAEQMGEGVSLVSAEAVHTESGDGFRAVYHFEDINKLRVNQNPGDSVSVPGEEEGESVEEFIRFKMTKGSINTLQIINPIQPTSEEKLESGEDPGTQAPSLEDSSGMLDMLKQLYADMLISIVVEVEGSIVDTNASYREGSQITIMEMDFGQLLEDEETFNTLINSDPETLEEMKELVQHVPGIKVETQGSVTVRFR